MMLIYYVCATGRIVLITFFGNNSSRKPDIIVNTKNKTIEVFVVMNICKQIKFKYVAFRLCNRGRCGVANSKKMRKTQRK